MLAQPTPLKVDAADASLGEKGVALEFAVEAGNPAQVEVRFPG